MAPIFALGELMAWCEKNSVYPSDENEAFVLASECSEISEEMKFRFSLTTPALLKKFIELMLICIDATYKLNWLGFPLVVLGSVDRMKRFHPLLYGCTSSESTDDYSFIFESVKNGLEIFYEAKFEPSTLIADGAIPIRNAYYNVCDTAKIDIMCYAHVVRNVRKRPFAMKNNKTLIIEDMRKLQSSPNRSVFQMMSRLFCKKWYSMEPNFIEYFQKQWLGALVNWFEGVADYTPSTNNSLESHNATIKRKITLRRRLPLNQFVVAMKEMTQDISLQFSTGVREMATEPSIKSAVMKNAALMHQNGFKCFKAKSSTIDTSVCLLPSSKCEENNANEAHYKNLIKRQWNSFDEYVKYGFNQFYIVHLSKKSWNKESTCTCVSFFKQNMCKHIIAVGMRENIIACPRSANPILLSRNKRKPGGIEKAKSALQYQ